MGGSLLNPLSEQIRLDFRASVPLYLQIARQVEQLLTSGDLKVGDQLPTVRELATELRINFNTVARAYRVLDEARIISTQRGRGTYIWEQPNEETMQDLRRKTLEELSKKYLLEVQRLGVTADEAIEKLKEISRSGEVVELEEQNEINS
jgi:GntR family transcriptional regulator